MQFAIVVFPGANCDHDVYHVAKHVLGRGARFVWHKEQDLGGADCVVLPGGFSYGDYLRAGALARFSPIMEAVARYAARGGLVLGICNGFQILLEAGLLPGAMRRNRSLKFACKDVHLRVESASTPFTSRFREGEVFTAPIAHAEGNYFLEEEPLRRLEGEGRVVLRYCDANGKRTDAANPNGSIGNIAGICNAGKNVLGLMPHPERSSEEILGGASGRRVFESILEAVGE